MTGKKLVLTSGSEMIATTVVTAYDTGTKRVTVSPALPLAPSNGVTFALLPDDISVTAMAAILASILAGSPIVYSGPVTLKGNADITIGDDYYFADGRQLQWAVPLSVADLTGASVTFIVPSVTGLGTVTATVLNAGLSNQSVYVELGRAQTGLFATDLASFALQAVLADAHEVTLIRSGTVSASLPAG